jgi:hypothetical protein
MSYDITIFMSTGTPVPPGTAPIAVDGPLANILLDYQGSDVILCSQDCSHFRVPKIYIENSSSVLRELMRKPLDAPSAAQALGAQLPSVETDQCSRNTRGPAFQCSAIRPTFFFLLLAFSGCPYLSSPRLVVSQRFPFQQRGKNKKTPYQGCYLHTATSIPHHEYSRPSQCMNSLSLRIVARKSHRLCCRVRCWRSIVGVPRPIQSRSYRRTPAGR